MSIFRRLSKLLREDRYVCSAIGKRFTRRVEPVSSVLKLLLAVLMFQRVLLKRTSEETSGYLASQPARSRRSQARDRGDHRQILKRRSDLNLVYGRFRGCRSLVAARAAIGRRSFCQFYGVGLCLVTSHC